MKNTRKPVGDFFGGGGGNKKKEISFNNVVKEEENKIENPQFVFEKKIEKKKGFNFGENDSSKIKKTFPKKKLPGLDLDLDIDTINENYHFGGDNFKKKEM